MNLPRIIVINTKMTVIGSLVVLVFLVIVIYGVSALTTDRTEEPGDPVTSTSQLAECKEAMRAQFRQALTNDTGSSRPPACDGVSDEDVQRLAYEVLDEEMAR